MKTVKAVQPYIYEGKINFKHKPYEAWKELGLPVAKSHYPWRWLHGLVFRLGLPRLFTSKKEARLRFVQPWTLNLDTWYDGLFYEIIPFFWDVWPDNIEITFKWLKRNKIKTAIFTSSQVADLVKKRFPKMNVMWCPEGIDIDTFKQGKTLSNREVDFLEYGRNIDNVVKYSFKNIIIIRGQKNGRNCLSYKDLLAYMQDSKIVAAYPKSYTNPELGGNVETLTQRYWECMLSRMVMVGHAPKELIDFIGYNPVIESDLEHPNEQLHDILSHIEYYQELVDKNRMTALNLGSWKMRMEELMKFLNDCGYDC